MIRSQTRILLALCVLLAAAMLIQGCRQKASMLPEERKAAEGDAFAESLEYTNDDFGFAAQFPTEQPERAEVDRDTTVFDSKNGARRTHVSIWTPSRAEAGDSEVRKTLTDKEVRGWMRDGLDSALNHMRGLPGSSQFSKSSITFDQRNGHPSATAIERHPIGVFAGSSPESAGQKVMWVYATVVHRDDGSIITLSGTRETESDAIAAEASFSSREALPPPAEEPAAPTLKRDKKTQAVERAKSYLESGAISKKGLVRQLEYEGFSRADAKFAVKYLAPDWDEEAVEAAENYVRFESFSKKSLIELLTTKELFTSPQAKLGARAVGFY